jgi:hypothetical protein
MCGRFLGGWGALVGYVHVVKVEKGGGLEVGVEGEQGARPASVGGGRGHLRARLGAESAVVEAADEGDRVGFVG